MEFREDLDKMPVSKKSLVWKIKSWMKRVLLYKIHLYK
jgi:hypothetical protein